MLPLVTVITPAFNRAAYLEETIESVLGQDYPAIEYIVIDDGSTDETPAVLRKYEGRVRAFRQPNMGEVNAINRGLTLASGDIIGVLSSDDPLRLGAIPALVDALARCPEAVVAYADYEVIGPSGGLIAQVPLQDYSILTMLAGYRSAITEFASGTLFRRSLLTSIGERDPSLKYAHDLDFWLRAALVGKFVHVRQFLTTHRTHPGNQGVLVCGDRFGDEVVRTVEKLFERKDLPKEVTRLRSTAYANAHELAVSYCGRSRWEQARHYALAFRYQPVRWTRRLLRYLYHSLRRRAGGPRPVPSQRGPKEV